MINPLITASLSKYEEAKVIGMRMEQLARNAPPTVSIGDETDLRAIAYKELKEGKIPCKIVRNILTGKKVISVNDLHSLKHK